MCLFTLKIVNFVKLNIPISEVLIPRYWKPVPFRNCYFYHETIFNPVMSGDKPADDKTKDIMPKDNKPKTAPQKNEKGDDCSAKQ